MTNESLGNRLGTADRHLISVIGDQDTVTGMLLAGIGNFDSHQKRNYLIVDNSKNVIIDDLKINSLFFNIETSAETVEECFKDFTTRRDIAIVLINQHVANKIRPLIETYKEMLPTILEIPSKDHPWDPEKDTILRKVNRMFASD